ncbi:MAG TPA: zinc-dependent alcohol dehydrogenase family protein [Dermatophilaceae bacterium]|nr:zinc-dependent alcohol dehydrogenase family protein [Dermatophilaceae bacterium]
MRATTIHAPFDIRVEDLPDPELHRPTDALVKVHAACVCGSDLWPYRGINDVTPGTRIGHEFVGTVEQVGDEVTGLRPGDFVIAPFVYSDNTCRVCRAGMQTSCEHGGFWGTDDEHGLPVDGGQGQWVRVPQAEGTLVTVPGRPGDDLLPDLLTLSDVMGTGWHCAVGAGVQPGDTVAVVGDGAVGLCAVIAAHLMGASMVVAMSRHEARQALATQFGATHLVAERGEQGVAKVRALTEGLGVDRALECVGTGEAMATAFDLVRPGGSVGFVGVPHGVELPIGTMFRNNIGIGGGIAPVRAYLPELRDRVLAGEIHPGRVFDLTLPLDEAPEAYAAMHERRATKVLLQPW